MKRKPKQILKQQKMLKNFGIRPMKPLQLIPTLYPKKLMHLVSNIMVKGFLSRCGMEMGNYGISSRYFSTGKSGFSKTGRLKVFSTILETQPISFSLGRDTLRWPVFMLPPGRPVSLPLTQVILGMFVPKSGLLILKVKLWSVQMMIT